MARRKSNKTSERVAAYREIYGSLSPLQTFTGLSPQKLTAIAQGTAKANPSERAKISAFGRRQQLGVVSYDLREAARQRGLSIGQVGQQLQDVAKGDFHPTARLDLGQIARTLGVEPQAVYHLSQEPRLRDWGKKELPARQITEAYMTKDGKLVAYGGDGNKYVAYTVTNKQTGKKRFFWARFESLGYLSQVEVADYYNESDYAFEIDTDGTGG